MKVSFCSIIILGSFSILLWLKVHNYRIYSPLHFQRDSVASDIGYRTNKISKINATEAIPPKYEPRKDIYYKHGGHNDNRSVFVVPRRVYFDNRVHKGKPRNIVLILAQVHDDAVEKIVACELNGFYSESISIIKENTHWVRLRRPGYTHCSIVVECKGLPSESIVNGSFPIIVYKKDEEKYYSFVVSEVPLILKSFKSTPARGNDSIVVCATMFGHPAKFDHWLKYQKAIGG